MQDLTERSVYREDHEQFREQARRFFEREIVPHHACLLYTSPSPRD